MPEKPKDEFIVSAAGPLVNIIIAGILWIYLTLISSADLAQMEYEVITEREMFWLPYSDAYKVIDAESVNLTVFRFGSPR